MGIPFGAEPTASIGLRAGIQPAIARLRVSNIMIDAAPSTRRNCVLLKRQQLRISADGARNSIGAYKTPEWQPAEERSCRTNMILWDEANWQVLIPYGAQWTGWRQRPVMLAVKPLLGAVEKAIRQQMQPDYPQGQWSYINTADCVAIVIAAVAGGNGNRTNRATGIQGLTIQVCHSTSELVA